MHQIKLTWISSILMQWFMIFEYNQQQSRKRGQHAKCLAFWWDFLNYFEWNLIPRNYLKYLIGEETLNKSYFWSQYLMSSPSVTSCLMWARMLVFHSNDVIMSAMASQSSTSPLFAQLLLQLQITENIKAPRHWPLCGKFTDDRWIPA